METLTSQGPREYMSQNRTTLASKASQQNLRWSAFNGLFSSSYQAFKLLTLLPHSIIVINDMSCNKLCHLICHICRFWGKLSPGRRELRSIRSLELYSNFIKMMTWILKMLDLHAGAEQQRDGENYHECTYEQELPQLSIICQYLLSSQPICLFIILCHHVSPLLCCTPWFKMSYHIICY